MHNRKSKNTIKLPDYPAGLAVMLQVQGVDVQGEFSHWTKHNEAYIKVKDENGDYKAWWRKPDKFVVLNNDQKVDFEPTVSLDKQAEEVVQIQTLSKFNINKRFEFLNDLVNMVLKKQMVSLLVTGDGGLGKTKTVMDAVDKAGLKENLDYYMVKGYSTAKGLYNTLYQQQDKLIIFDDCDEVLENEIARSLLKGALDSYDTRIVHWISNVISEEIPPSFEFTGAIIFISNLPKEKIFQPLLSRAANIDVRMTMEDKIKRMENILPKLMPKVNMDKKKESLDLLTDMRHECRDLNFRTLMKVISIRNSGKKDWRSLAEYMILS